MKRVDIPLYGIRTVNKQSFHLNAVDNDLFTSRTSSFNIAAIKFILNKTIPLKSRKLNNNLNNSPKNERMNGKRKIRKQKEKTQLLEEFIYSWRKSNYIRWQEHLFVILRYLASAFNYFLFSQTLEIPFFRLREKNIRTKKKWRETTKRKNEVIRHKCRNWFSFCMRAHTINERSRTKRRKRNCREE